MLDNFLSKQKIPIVKSRGKDHTIRHEGALKIIELLSYNITVCAIFNCPKRWALLMMLEFCDVEFPFLDFQ